MSKEIENLVANSKNPEGLARIFEQIAEMCREPLVFTDDDNGLDGAERPRETKSDV